MFGCEGTQAKHRKHSNEERQVHLFRLTEKHKSLRSELGRNSTNDGVGQCPSIGQGLSHRHFPGAVGVRGHPEDHSSLTPQCRHPGKRYLSRLLGSLSPGKA
jgi:hypothetical protein